MQGAPEDLGGEFPVRRAGRDDADELGAQLLLDYWFYSYLTWFYPLLIIAVIRARRC